MTYLTRKEIGDEVTRVLKKDDRSQEKIAEALDMNRSSITKAKDLEKYPYYRTTAVRLLRDLAGTELSGPYWKVERPEVEE